MQALSPQGQQVVQDLANRFRLSVSAVTELLYAVSNGNGSMAQFSHPELGGSGQWMRGGMTMVGDMFNGQLKMTVDGVCSALSDQIMNQPLFQPAASFQSQHQGNSSYSGSGFAAGNLFVQSPNSGQWWPAELGVPSSTGAQNDARYAVFPYSRRLAISAGGTLTVYDTLDHQIGGVSQQQGGYGSMSFSSQYGYVAVSTLPVISVNGQAPSAPEPAYVAAPEYTPPAVFQETFSTPSAPSWNAAATQGQSPAQEQDVFAKIERLAELKQRGILSDDEFSAKKAELLSRI